MNVVRFYRSIYRDNRQRKEQKRSLSRDLWLYAKNRLLQPVEAVLVAAQGPERFPLVFIVGPPRSGTTVLYQLVAKFLEVSYVNNFVARYWMAPLYATMAHRRRFPAAALEIPLESNLGGTAGVHSPHEFSYFWQFWTDFGDTDDLSPAELARIRWRPIRRELNAIANYTQRPLVLKCINYANYNIPHFREALPNSRFIYIRRDPTYVVQSILESREARYGSREVWWSTRPRDFAAWLDRPPVEQVCHQVRDICARIERDLPSLPESRRLVLDYETVVREPQGELSRIAEFLGVAMRRGPELASLRLRSGNVRRLEPSVVEAIVGRMEATS